MNKGKMWWGIRRLRAVVVGYSALLGWVGTRQRYISVRRDRTGRDRDTKRHDGLVVRTIYCTSLCQSSIPYDISRILFYSQFPLGGSTCLKAGSKIRSQYSPLPSSHSCLRLSPVPLWSQSPSFSLSLSLSLKINLSLSLPPLSLIQQHDCTTLPVRCVCPAARSRMQLMRKAMPGCAFVCTLHCVLYVRPMCARVSICPFMHALPYQNVQLCATVGMCSQATSITDACTPVPFHSTPPAATERSTAPEATCAHILPHTHSPARTFFPTRMPSRQEAKLYTICSRKIHIDFAGSVRRGTAADASQ